MEFIGQRRVVELSGIIVDSSIAEGSTLPHILFSSNRGMGKTTLSEMICNEYVEQNGAMIHQLSNGDIEANELVEIIGQIEHHDILYIDEIHQMAKRVQELLYDPMTAFTINVTESLIDKESNRFEIGRNPLPPFSLVCATTEIDMLNLPFKDRFGLIINFDNYTTAELIQIVKTHFISNHRMIIKNEHANLICKTGKMNPRITKHVCEIIHRYCVSHNTNLSEESVKRALELVGIDENGLTSEDMQVLAFLYGNSPAGMMSIKNSTGIKEGHYLSNLEPYLVSSGLIKRSPRGRTITPKGIETVDMKRGVQ